MVFRSLAWWSVAGLTALILVLFLAREIWINEKIAGARGAVPSSRLPDAPAVTKDSRPTVLLLGDSRLSRWPAKGHEPWRVLNRAIGGETASQLARRFQDEILRFRPAQVVVSSGINDIVGMSFMPAGEPDAAITTLVETFASFADQANRSGSRLVITTIIPPSRPSLFRQFVWSCNTVNLVQKVNKRLQTLRWPPNTTILDLDRTFHLDRDGYLSSEYREDTLHLNTIGYAHFEQAIFAALKENE